MKSSTIHNNMKERIEMKEHLYSVGIRHKKTGEKSSLFVWARNTDEATHKLTGTLIGHDCEYAWTGSGPVYQNNKLVSREWEANKYE